MLFKNEAQLPRSIRRDNVEYLSVQMGVTIIKSVGKKEFIDIIDPQMEQITLTVHAYHPDTIRDVREELQRMILTGKYDLIVAARGIARILELV